MGKHLSEKFIAAEAVKAITLKTALNKVDLVNIASILSTVLKIIKQPERVNLSRPIILTPVENKTMIGIVEVGRRKLTQFILPKEVETISDNAAISEDLVRVANETFKVQVINGSIFASSINQFGGPEMLNKFQRAVLARPRLDKPASAEENRSGRMVRVRLALTLVEALDKTAREERTTRTDIVERALLTFLNLKP
jgi:hypothetical protein